MTPDKPTKPRLRHMTNSLFNDPLLSEWCIDLPEGWDMKLTHYSESEGEGVETMLIVEITASKRKEDV